MIQRPQSTEYASRFEDYISLVPGDDLVKILKDDLDNLLHFFSKLPPDKADYRYAAGKWSVKEIVMHLSYVERIMSYRAFVASRGDEQAVFGPINHPAYFNNSEAAAKTMEELLDEFTAIRQHTIHLFTLMSAGQSMLKAGSPENGISARAVGYALAGHIHHHIKVIKERYL